MERDNDPLTDIDEETYESKAIAAYLANEISAVDLIESLGVSRAQTYRLIQRYQDAGEKGLVSKNMANAIGCAAMPIANRLCVGCASIMRILVPPLRRRNFGKNTG